MSTEVTATAAPTTAASTAAALSYAPSQFPAAYVEADPAQRSSARLAHILGIFGILGTGIYYAVKKNEAGPFAKDQMKEAFNFQLLVLCVSIALNIVGAIVANIAAALAIVVSLASLALFVGVLVLLIKNAIAAGNGQVARYPARIRAIK